MARKDIEKLACAALRLAHPDDQADQRKLHLYLGTFSILESAPALDAVVEDWITHLQKHIRRIGNDAGEVRQAIREASDIAKRRGEPAPDFDEQALTDMVLEDLAETERAAVLRYTDFIKFHGRADTELKRETATASGLARLTYAARHTFAQLQEINSYSKDRAGYRKYLKQACARAMPPDDANSLFDVTSERLPALVPEAGRREHTYMVSTTGTGKSELLKAIVLNYIRLPSYCGVVVIDPGDMTKQIARWPEVRDRLVYIDPRLRNGYVPCLNPFDADDLSADDRETLTDEIVVALQTQLEDETGGNLTANMKTLLNNSIRLMIDTPGATLRDLEALMLGDPEWEEAGQNAPMQQTAQFFQTGWNNPNLSGTKGAIATKLNLVLNGPLEPLLCGPTTVPLEQLLNNNRIVLVNVSEIGEAAASAYGMLFVSLIQAIARRRGRLPEAKRPITHLVIDECQNFISSRIKKIIREGRKYGLAFTLAQQEVGGDMPADVAEVVTNTSNVVIAGRSKAAQISKYAKLVEVSENEFRQLPDKGEFFYKSGAAPAFRLRILTDRLGFRGGVHDQAWGDLVRTQLEQYYRPVGVRRKPPKASDITDVPDAAASGDPSLPATHSSRRTYTFE